MFEIDYGTAPAFGQSRKGRNRINKIEIIQESICLCRKFPLPLQQPKGEICAGINEGIFKFII
jgi:hypothetical protein